MTKVSLLQFVNVVFLVLKAQEDIAGGQKRDEEGEDQYNEDKRDQVCSVGKQSILLFSIPRFP